MSSDLESDLAALKAEMDAARAELASVVASLSEGDLDCARRGGWPVRRVLEHVIESEWMYAAATAFLNGKPSPASQPSEIRGVAEIVPKLESGRQALIEALEGIDEERFYAIRKIGHEEYSVLSVLENVANHDREHAAQIRKIAGEG